MLSLKRLYNIYSSILNAFDNLSSSDSLFVIVFASNIIILSFNITKFTLVSFNVPESRWLINLSNSVVQVLLSYYPPYL